MKDFMKRISSLTAVMLFSLSLFFVGCSDDDDPVAPKKSESQILVEYLEANGDFINTAAPAMINADAVRPLLNFPDKNLVIDVRAPNDRLNGWIKGSVNVTIPNLYNYFKNDINPASYEKIILVCYTGQSASYATSLLRMLGHNNVFAMKFGMSSWHDDFAANYKNTIANGNARQAQFVTDDTPKAAKGTVMPTITTGKTNGKDILEARVKALFEIGFITAASNPDGCALSNNDLFNNLGNYYIVNYWPYAHYKDPGHIPGAMQYTPKESLKFANDLLTLPIDKEVVIYCYTGQTSAHVAAFLRLLGYKARTLQYGTSAMIYDMVIAKGLTAFKTSDIMNYEYEK